MELKKKKRRIKGQTVKKRKHAFGLWQRDLCLYGSQAQWWATSRWKVWLKPPFISRFGCLFSRENSAQGQKQAGVCMGTSYARVRKSFVSLQLGTVVRFCVYREHVQQWHPENETKTLFKGTFGWRGTKNDVTILYKLYGAFLSNQSQMPVWTQLFNINFPPALEEGLND